MKKTISLILFLYISLIFASCVKFKSSGTHYFVTGNDSTKVFLGSEYLGQGDTVKGYYEPEKGHQLRFETPGYKPEFRNFISGYIARWTYFHLDTLIKVKYRDENMKKLRLLDVSINIPKGKKLINKYEFLEYMDSEKPEKTEVYMDDDPEIGSIKESLLEQLVDLCYADSITSVLIDNINTLQLSAEIDSLAFNYLWSNRHYTSYSFLLGLSADVQTKWFLSDIYGDTLYSWKIKARSGIFAVETSKIVNEQGFIVIETSNKELAVKKEFSAISDAIFISFIDLTYREKFQEIMARICDANLKLDNFVVKKPDKTPGSLAESLEATVTIKNNQSHGSGFLISNDGYIITNYHVVNKKDKMLTVITNDGREYKANFIRSNKIIDLALIKIEGNFDVAFVIPGKKNFKLTQEIFAIGTPKSVKLGQSTSNGIVSGFRKKNNRSYIQTDININSGNSGGPVISKDGELVGIVEYKLTGYLTEGLSFAIPAYSLFEALSISY